MKEIPLSRGLVAVVDDEDYDACSQYHWSLLGRPDSHHVGSTVDGLRVYLHNFLMRPPLGMEVDHRNRDGLDNQRSNLRICTHAQNMANRRHRRDSSSPYKGAELKSRPPRWRASICSRHLGYFDTAEEAARAYDAAAFAEWGEFALLNFPNESHTTTRTPATTARAS